MVHKHGVVHTPLHNVFFRLHNNAYCRPKSPIANQTTVPNRLSHLNRAACCGGGGATGAGTGTASGSLAAVSSMAPSVAAPSVMVALPPATASRSAAMWASGLVAVAPAGADAAAAAAGVVGAAEDQVYSRGTALLTMNSCTEVRKPARQGGTRVFTVVQCVM